ncbi:MAG TPA: hypothetical protein VGP22_05550, partial [Albitalea sp.]|nr:hypothetical protein [Albitalea sp.]
MTADRRRWRRWTAALAFAGVPVFASSAWAQAADASLERRLEQSLKRIESLAARVEQLERQLAATPVPVQAPAPATAPEPAPAPTAARIDELEKTVGQLTAAS